MIKAAIDGTEAYLPYIVSPGPGSLLLSQCSLRTSAHFTQTCPPPVQEEFNSLFLLSQVNTVIAPQPKELGEALMDVAIWALSGRQITAPRFVREHGKLIMWFWTHYVR